MSTITTRAGKGSPLTNTEMDTNLTNLNTDKVEGPASSTDNAITRFDSTTGKVIQNSLVTVADNGAITAPSVGSVIPFYFANQAAFPSATTYHGALAHSHSDGKVYFAHSSSWNALANASDLPTLGTGVATFLATPSSANLASALTDENGSNTVAFTTSPTFVTPSLGVASATSFNKVAITAPATGSTLTIADGKTLTASNTLTFTGTDASSVAFGTGGTVAYTANKLSEFAATTSSELLGVISDETGSGSLVFATSPTLVTPTLGVASATTVNKVTLTTPATGSTLTVADGKTLTASNTLTLTGTDASSVAFGTGGTVAYLGANTFTAAQEWASGTAIASASTINLNTATGNRVHITGTTAITAVTLTRGPRTVIFDGILTLTHHATNNNLPGAANITTAAGDRAIYESDGTTVYCVSYIKASGASVVAAAGGFSKIEAYTSSTTWSVPVGVTLCKITVTGAGGGGGTSYACGGGAGGSAIKYLTLSGGSITITIGTGGTNSAGAGNVGGSSSAVYGATTITGTGGAGGNSQYVSGGTGTGGDINIPAGSAPATAVNGANGVSANIWGAGFTPAGGSWGAGGSIYNSFGSPTTVANASNGVVIIEY